MKKVSVFLLLLIVFISFSLAQENDSNDVSSSTGNNVDDAYRCLENLVDDKEKNEISLEEAVFSTLALGVDSKLQERIEDLQGNDCWPQSSCTIKETSQVLLAEERVGKDTEDVEEWLSSNNRSAEEIKWFLQIIIGSNEASSCTVRYDDTDYNINVNEDMTLSGNGGSCLNVDSSGFWLGVGNSCMGKEFTISCDKDFLTSLLYQKSGSDLIFVSPTTSSAASLGTTKETVNSLCLGASGSCDYEGTLWGALALDKTGNNIDNYLPYLLALAEDNENLFPASFLYILTNGDDQYSSVVQSQKNGQYWQESTSSSSRFYDTSLGMLSLQGTSAQELNDAQNYLLSIQTDAGCWNNNNVRDTGFLLYSGWPRGVSGVTGSLGGTSCQDAGNYCVSSVFSCINDASGFVVNGNCNTGVCCTEPILLDSCGIQGGSVCSASQTCSGNSVSSLEGSCCLGSCENLDLQVNSCEAAGGFCDSTCQSGEEQDSSLNCDSGSVKICCIVSDTKSGGGSLWIWITVISVLIILAIVGIVYRRRLQLMFFKLGKGRGRRMPSGGRPMPPAGMRRPMPMARPKIRGVSRGPGARRTPSKTDKELDDTLKKLKEISK